MSSVPFDTHAAVKRLTEAGMAEAQAEALIRAITEAQARAELATRSDLRELEMRLIKWGIALVAPVYALLIAILLT